MNENVTYKALLYIILGVIVVIVAFFGNAQSKFDQVGKNEKSIKEINKTIHKNQIEVLKGQGEIKLLLKDKQDRE